MSGNRLGSETSPYLLQHENNPVHWWAWGDEALAEAKRLDKPILLSVGYAACHWCHVMAHESFEDDETARVMNAHFINIKVDREERPDIDAIYMEALHLMGEQGGWPLTMFLTPEGEPFWGGTYFPKQAKYGRPSFCMVLEEVARIYREEPETVRNNTGVITKHLRQRSLSEGGGEAFTLEDLKLFAGKLVQIVDMRKGGVQGAPKFPQVSLFDFLWRAGLAFDFEPARRAVEVTLLNICQGGIYDHLGGGFARYSVDDKWLVPHFEKMLYDNAQLIMLMTHVWRETRSPVLAERISETVDWVFREMTVTGGGFASSLDADSEGEEGKYYVWGRNEIFEVLGDERAADFAAVYDVSAGGNFEAKNILNRLEAKDFLGEDSENMLKTSRNVLLSSRTSRDTSLP